MHPSYGFVGSTYGGVGMKQVPMYGTPHHQQVPFYPSHPHYGSVGPPSHSHLNRSSMSHGMYQQEPVSLEGMSLLTTRKGKEHRERTFSTRSFVHSVLPTIICVVVCERETCL